MLLHPTLLAPVLTGLLLAAAPAWANNCESLRTAIETRIRTNGVANPVLNVVPTEANAPGRVVGSCDKGAMKIMYVAGPSSGAASAAGAPAAPAAAPATATATKPRAAVITECADGRVITSGSCKK